MSVRRVLGWFVLVVAVAVTYLWGVGIAVGMDKGQTFAESMLDSLFVLPVPLLAWGVAAWLVPFWPFPRRRS